MGDRDEYDSLIDEAARRRYEEAWLDGQPKAVESFLPPEQDPRFLPTLEELIHIELEFSWGAYASRTRNIDANGPTLLQAPLVESYLERFPQLQDPGIVARLVEQEFRVRCDVGHAASLADYQNRFPQLVIAGGELESKLKAIATSCVEPAGDTLLAETNTGSDHRSRADTSHTIAPCFGNYELLEQLGRGGMGVVYKARQLTADRIVALKVIRRDWLESMPRDARASALDRFRHEAQAEARIEHEHIVRVYEVGSVEGEPFFSMQYVDGQSLAELTADGPLPGRRAAALLEPVARAVDEAHRRGILHRDLKPQNILVERQTDSALVADFGLAKLLQTSDELTCAGDVMGSPPYMSPEQARDSTSVTTQSDVYALGATLYHALVGKPPFRADTALDTLSRVVHEQPVPPRQIAPTIDPDLETICLKCLEKEPARRYLSASAMADDLKCYLVGAPISARPVGTLERCWLWCRRNPLVATLVASTAVFLMLALVASMIGYFQTRSALNTAERRHRETRQVLNDFFTRISEDRLLNEPGMQPLRKELLQNVLPYFRRFLVEFAKDPTIPDELALTHFRIGLITEEIEEPQDALPWYETARRMQEEILAGEPADGDGLRDLGNTLTAIGRVLQLQARHDEAREACQETIQIRERLVQATSSDNEAQRMLANSYMNLGLLEKDVGNLDAAIDPYRQAQAIRQQILEVDSKNEMTRRDLGRGSFNLGMLAVARTDHDSARSDSYLSEAREHLRHAATVFEGLLEGHSRDLGNQHRLVLCYRMLADLETEFPESLKLYDQAIDGMELLALRNPDVPDYQADLAVLHLQIGSESLDHDPQVAGDHLDAARRGLEDLVIRHPSVSRYKRDLALTLQEVATVLWKRGQDDAARRCLQSARSLFLELVAEFPKNEEFANELAENAQFLKILDSDSKPDGSE